MVSGGNFANGTLQSISRANDGAKRNESDDDEHESFKKDERRSLHGVLELETWKLQMPRAAASRSEAHARPMDLRSLTKAQHNAIPRMKRRTNKFLTLSPFQLLRPKFFGLENLKLQQVLFLSTFPSL